MINMAHFDTLLAFYGVAPPAKDGLSAMFNEEADNGI